MSIIFVTVPLVLVLFASRLYKGDAVVCRLILRRYVCYKILRLLVMNIPAGDRLAEHVDDEAHYIRYTVCPKKVSPLTFCNNNRKSAPI